MPGTVHPRERLEVLCIGGANVDGDFRLAAAAIAGTSNPATARTAFGGVARNVAEDLARLGRRTGLVSRVGDDAAGRGLLDHAAGLGIDVRHVLVAAGATTSQYLAIHDPDGELVVNVDELQHKNKVTPYDGKKAFGTVTATFLRGEKVYEKKDDRDVFAPRPTGRHLCSTT